VARLLERQGRAEQALPIWRQIHDMAGPGAQAPYALAIARCQARLGRARQAHQWLARVPRGAGRDAEVRQMRRLIRQARAGSGVR
jgi:thioredoxin-like negative regulator of GroEL